MTKRPNTEPETESDFAPEPEDDASALTTEEEVPHVAIASPPRLRAETIKTSPASEETYLPGLMSRLIRTGVFVSTKGSDYTGNGSFEKPFRTHKQAVRRAMGLGTARCGGIVHLDWDLRGV